MAAAPTIALAVTAPASFGVRLARRESVRAAVFGLAIAAVCALVAAVAGEARAFFLIPTLLPAGWMLLIEVATAPVLLASAALTVVASRRAVPAPAAAAPTEEWALRHPSR